MRDFLGEGTTDELRRRAECRITGVDQRSSDDDRDRHPHAGVGQFL